jgi:hypothetical protein
VKAAERKALIPLLAVMVAAPIFGGILWYQSRAKTEATTVDLAALPGDDRLTRYSFAMPPAEVSALFGPGAKPGAKVKLRDDGVFTEIELGGVGGPTYSVALAGGPKLDVARMFGRLAKIAPNRLEQDAATQREISVGRTLLRVDPRPSTGHKARVHVMTWVQGERGVKAADAFLATVRYAALDGPAPTAEQLRLLNGTPLAEATRFDVTTPIEDAATRFATTFGTSECVTQTDLLTKRTELTCTTDVDAAVVSQARFAWPSAAKTRLRQVTFVRPKRSAAAAPDPAACLETALGRGEEKVVDFASGAKVRSWPLGKRGDRVVVDSDTIEVVAREGAKPDEVADFAQAYPKIIDALARCARPAP